MVDLTSGPLGAIGRALAELGCDVVRVEPPGGGSDRNDRLAFAAANLGKRGVALALTDPRFETLAGHADILIEAARPGSAQDAALASLCRRFPTLVVLACRDFGEGPLQSWQATDLVLHALSSLLSRSGAPGQPPLAPPGELAIACAAAQGVYAVLIGWLNRLAGGRGGRLELSLLDAAAQVMDPGFGVAGSAAMSVSLAELPRDRPPGGHQYPIIPCEDGHARLTVLAQRQWRGLFEWMGRPPELADPALNDVQVRFESQILRPRIARFFADKTRAEIEAEGAEHHVPVAGVLTLAEVMASEQIRARQAFVEVEIAPGVAAPFPNGVVEIDGVRAGPRGPAPEADGDAARVLADWGKPRAAWETPAFGASGLPLAGLRVLDLGVIVVGSEQGRLLADYGAQVIKLETADFPDGMRANAQAAPGGMSAAFANGQRNKLGMGLGLRSAEGRGLFLRLAAKSDVVLSNFKPGTLQSLGLGPEVLMAANPALIVVENSAFGGTGPWRERLGYGPLVRASAGLTDQWRYPGADFSDHVTVYPDHVAARVGIYAVLALLARRLRSGRGGVIGLSQAEVMLSHQAATIAAQALGEVAPVRQGPWGVFACAGDDEWCVVTARNDADRAALAGVLAGEPLETWLAARDPHAAAAALQASGVPAAPMLRVAELLDHGHFRYREVFQRFHQPGLDEPVVVDNAPVRSQGLARPPLAPAPHLGEHTRLIAREVLELDDAEIDRLFAAKVLEGPQ